MDEVRLQTEALARIARSGVECMDEYGLKEILYRVIAPCPGLYKNPRYVGQGGTSLVVRADDSGEDVAMKFALPMKDAKKKRKELIFDWLTKKASIDDQLSLKEEFEKRFKRGCKIQEFAYKIMRKKGAQKYGYIPEIFSRTQNDSANLFYTMEYVHAKPLLEYCKNLTHNDLLELFRSILVFVNEVLHKSGLVHSDLKPDNILVNDSGLPVIIDFDLAKNIVDKTQEVTHQQSVLGNPKFSSPQQLRLSKERTRADDVFNLGLTFWCMMVGESPRLPIGLTIHDDVPLYDLFGVSEIPQALEPFQDFFLTATAPSREERFRDITQALINFDRSYTFWCKKSKTTINQSTTNIINKHTRINWDEAKKGLRDPANSNWMFDLVQGIELLFFGEDNNDD